MKRRTWTQDEDKLLMEIVLKEKRPIQWRNVSDVFSFKVGLPGRTPKQCRQRWRHILDPCSDPGDLTPQEEGVMLQYQNENGNKWAEIATLLNKRTSLYVKNQFYSFFRRISKSINFRLGPRHSKIFSKEFTFHVLRVNNQRFNESPSEPASLVELSQQIKTIILGFRLIKPEEYSQEQLQRLVQLTREFTLLAQLQQKQSKDMLTFPGFQMSKGTFDEISLQGEDNIESMGGQFSEMMQFNDYRIPHFLTLSQRTDLLGSREYQGN